jgi:gluconokinase
MPRVRPQRSSPRAPLCSAAVAEREREQGGGGTRVVVVMGVSGSGKTTVGRLLAQRLGALFADADDDHPPENVAKMRSGRPLVEADRLPWLRILRGRVEGWLARGTPAVLACSALTRASRALLRVDPARVQFVHLAGPRETLLARMTRRSGHFMPAELLDEQLATLEPPEPDEALVVDLEQPPDAIVEQVVRLLGSR